MSDDRDTIVAPATAPGGALAVVRISGTEALACCDRIFRGREPLTGAAGYTVHYGRIVDGERTVDDVLATVFRAPRSYTGEDSVELSCHGSSYIVAELLRLLIGAGCRMATPGEFTLRAYLAGKMDLSQAEAVADLIASSSRAAHALASTQMRGSYSAVLDTLRDELLRLTALLELELDFAEEDVQFADRGELRRTMERIGREIDALRSTFALGNALREGVAVAIVGAPNAGKSTLLNRLAGDDRAMVSEIAGTTRDVVEERIVVDGVAFRFLDTAGIHATDDRLERMGIARTMDAISRAAIVIRLVDATRLEEDGNSGKTGRDAGTDGHETDFDGPDGLPSAGNRLCDNSATTPSVDGIRNEKGSPDDGHFQSGGIETPDLNSLNTSGLPHGNRFQTGGIDGLPHCDSAPPRPGYSARLRDVSAGDAGVRNVASYPGHTPGTPADRQPDTDTASTAPILPPAESVISGSPSASSQAALGFTLRQDQRLLTVVNKIDLRPALHLPSDTIAISAREGEGIDALRTALRAAVDTDALYHGDAVVSHGRHYEALTQAREALTAALDALDADLPTDLLSEEIRSVIRALGSITSRGAIATDEVLGHIFSKFCIGK